MPAAHSDGWLSLYTSSCLSEKREVKVVTKC